MLIVYPIELLNSIPIIKRLALADRHISQSITKKKLEFNTKSKSFLKKF